MRLAALSALSSLAHDRQGAAILLHEGALRTLSSLLSGPPQELALTIDVLMALVADDHVPASLLPPLLFTALGVGPLRRGGGLNGTRRTRPRCRRQLPDTRPCPGATAERARACRALGGGTLSGYPLSSLVPLSLHSCSASLFFSFSFLSCFRFFLVCSLAHFSSSPSSPPPSSLTSFTSLLAGAMVSAGVVGVLLRLLEQAGRGSGAPLDAAVQIDAVLILANLSLVPPPSSAFFL